MSLDYSDLGPDSGGSPPPGDARLHHSLLELRARAEKRRQLVTQATEHLTPGDAQRLVQELQVHQIELEMQYEELLLAQAEAQTARTQYVDLYDFAPVGYFTLSEVGLIMQLNLCASQQLGTVRQRLMQRRFALFVAPNQRLEFGQFLARVFSTDTTQSMEVELHRENGSPFYAQLEGLRADLPTGPQCRLAVLDITARRQASEALAASEARFRKLFADSSDAVVLLQGQRFVDCNEAALRLLGARREDIVGQLAWAHAPKLQSDGRRTIEVFRESLEVALRTGSRRCEAQMIRLSGELIWVEAVLTPIEQGSNPPLVHVVWRDMTAERAAGEELRLSQERLQMALAASNSGVWRWEMADNQLIWDANTQAIFGRPYDPNPVSFDVLRAAVHPDDFSLVSTALKRTVEQRVPLDLEYRVVWPDGSMHYVAAVGRAVFDERNEPLRLIGIIRDVTPRREAEEALRHEKEFTESLLENTVDGIMALDRDQRVVAWNATSTKYFGRPAAAVLGRPLAEAIPYLDHDSVNALNRALAGERVDLHCLPFQRHPGHYDANIVPLYQQGEDQPSGVLAIVRDVTERNRLAEETTQMRLRQQQEVLAAILTTQESERKRIAEALHNGLGQLLYATKLSLERRGTTPPASARESLKLLDEAIRSTRTISFELTPGILEDFGLRIALEQLVKRLTPARLDVHLHVTLPKHRLPPQVEIAVYRIVQELLNNVMKHAHATEVEVHVVYENGRIEVSVEDDGRGFDPSTLTTQLLAGIGLSGVRNRVALLGGTLAIKSQLGRGTIISFELNV